MVTKLEAAKRLLATSGEVELNLKIRCSGDAGLTLINLLAAIEYNTNVGHSCTIGAFFDGDGADKISIEGLPDNKGKDMAEACGNHGDDLMAHIGDYSASVYNTSYNDTGEQVLRRKTVYPSNKEE